MRAVKCGLAGRLLVAVWMVLVVGTLGACRPKATAERTRVAVSVFPVFDLVKRVAGPDADVTLVSEATAAAARADLGVAVGLGFDPWMTRALATEKKSALLKVGDRVPTLSIDDAGEGGDAPQDPHVWLDPQRAQLMVRAVAESLGRVDGAHALAYRARATELDAQLAALDKELETRIGGLPGRAVPATGFEAFRYFAERYRLERRGPVTHGGGHGGAELDPFGGKPETDSYEKLLRVNVTALETRAR